MTKDHRKFSVQDLSNKGNDITLEVNWNKKVKDNQFLKFKIADKEAIISYNHLWTILFITANDEQQQEKMLPTKLEMVRTYNTIVDIKAKKNIKANETIRIPMSVTIDSKGQLRIKP